MGGGLLPGSGVCSQLAATEGLLGLRGCSLLTSLTQSCVSGALASYFLSWSPAAGLLAEELTKCRGEGAVSCERTVQLLLWSILTFYALDPSQNAFPMLPSRPRSHMQALKVPHPGGSLPCHPLQQPKPAQDQERVDRRLADAQLLSQRLHAHFSVCSSHLPEFINPHQTLGLLPKLTWK